MKIFLTGGTGFIGSPLVKILLKNGHKLLILSRWPPKSIKTGVAFLKGDLANLSSVKSKIKSFKPQTIIHLAWQGIPDYSAATSLKNLEYGLNLLSLASIIGAKKFLAAGTCWEYGERVGRLKEGSDVKPLNIFALAKDCFRRLAETASQENKLCFIWMRFFYVYGPGQKESSLIPHLIKSSKNNKAPDLKTPGIRNDFIYINDAALAIAMIAERANKSAVYNIGSGRPTSVGKIAKIIYPEYTYPISVRQPGFYADLEKIRKEIGWRPETDIKTGVQLTINWFQKNEQ